MDALDQNDSTSVHPAWIVVPHVAISFVNWGNIILSLNRYRGLRSFSAPEMIALWILLLGRPLWARSRPGDAHVALLFPGRGGPLCAR